MGRTKTAAAGTEETTGEMKRDGRAGQHPARLLPVQRPGTGYQVGKPKLFGQVLEGQ